MKIIIAIICACSLLLLSCTPGTNVGMTYNPQTGEWSANVQTPAAVDSKTVHKVKKPKKTKKETTS